VAQVQERARRSALEQRRIGAALLLVIAAALGGLLWRETRQPPVRSKQLQSALTRAGFRTGLAIACVMLGMAALALFGTLER
jgi:hypothetical protein